MRARTGRVAGAGLAMLAVAGVILIASATSRDVPRGANGGAADRRFIVGIYEEPTTQNLWAREGPERTTVNGNITAGAAPRLFHFTAGRWDWVPRLAEDVPTTLERDARSGLWRSTVRIKQGISWSDGTPVTAHDVAFTFQTVATLGAAKMGGGWPTNAPPDVLARVEATDDHTVEFRLYRRDGRYRFNILTTPIFQRRFWQPHLEAALASPDPLNAIFSVDVSQEPVAGPFLKGRWERGAFVERPANPRYSWRGASDTLFANGAVRVDDGHGHVWSGYGNPSGPVDATIVSGPHVDAVHYRLFGSRSAAVLALQAGEVDYLMQNLERGFVDQLRGMPGVEVIANPVNNLRLLGFNLRRAPMSDLSFRQAVATLIDRDFVARQVLQGDVIPQTSIVPSASTEWHNPRVPVYGQGLSRPDRIRTAVRTLESAGYTWASKPELMPDGSLRQPGVGLRTPDGAPVRSLQFLIPTEAEDPFRIAFGLWIDRWLSEVGIPVRRVPLNFNVLLTRVYDEQDTDLWLTGFGLGNYPQHLHGWFHSSNAARRGRNASGYVSPEFDREVDAFLGETDDIDRAHQLAFAVQDRLAREVPYIPLFGTLSLEAYRSDRVRFPTTSGLGGIQAAPIPGLIDSVEGVE